MENNTWAEWGRFVLEELKRLNKNYDNILTEVGDVKVEIAKLKIKAAGWGAIGASVPILITIAIYIFVKG